jgi:hypothetical protein
MEPSNLRILNVYININMKNYILTINNIIFGNF